jgi:predicted GIY-YIG superfamily endonuclease
MRLHIPMIERQRLLPAVSASVLMAACLITAAWAAEGDELQRVVQESFAEVHDGWSVDEVLVDDELNGAFVERCRMALPDAETALLNWTLLTLRKAGKLETEATKRRVLRHEKYLHAAEIAARWMYDKYELSTDRVMCDPDRRREFDQVAQTVAPGVSAYRLRKAALSLRKARKLRPELVARVADWKKEVITRPASDVADDPRLVPEKPGIYIFRDTTGYLYIGQSSDLRQRVASHLDASDRTSLANYFQAHGITNVTVELHAFDPASNARLLTMRRAYESELIRSRRPRLNVAP